MCEYMHSTVVFNSVNMFCINNVSLKKQLTNKTLLWGNTAVYEPKLRAIYRSSLNCPVRKLHIAGKYMFYLL